jgi:hypothetical protein
MPTRDPRRRRVGQPVGPRLLIAAVILGVAGCGTSTPSVTPRPEFAWTRATIELPSDVVDVAPGSSSGIQCSPCHAVQASLLNGVTQTTAGLLAVGIQLPPSTAVAYRSTDGRDWRPEPGFTADDGTAALAAAFAGEIAVIVGSRGRGAMSWA